MTGGCVTPRASSRCWQRFSSIAVVLVLMALPAGVLSASPLDDAIAVVDRLHSALISAAATTGADTESRYAMLYPVIVETHNLPAIAQLTVRRYWRDWTVSEREAFVSAFEDLSVMTYASRFSAVGADSFEIVGSHVDGDRIEVNALIKRNGGEDVTMDYLLRRDGDNWRIVNILAEGVSDLALKIDEYTSVLETGTVGDLIGYLEAQTESLR